VATAESLFLSSLKRCLARRDGEFPLPQQHLDRSRSAAAKLGSATDVFSRQSVFSLALVEDYQALCKSSELGSFIRANRRWMKAALGELIEDPRHVMPGETEIYR
jgi:hypothetical protein